MMQRLVPYIFRYFNIYLDILILSLICLLSAIFLSNELILFPVKKRLMSTEHARKYKIKVSYLLLIWVTVMLWRWIFFTWKCPSSWRLVFSHNFMLKPSSYFKKRTFLKSGASVFTHFIRTTGNLLTTIFYLENKISSIVTIYRHGWTWNLHTQYPFTLWKYQETSRFLCFQVV